MGLPKSISQVELFDIPVYGSQAMAPLIGDFYSGVISSLFGGSALETNGHYPFCPDVFVDADSSVIEVKAAERSNNFKLSRYQLSKYRKVYDSGIGVRYAFVVYSVGGRRPIYKNLPTKTVRSVLELLTSSIQFVVVLDFSIVMALLRDKSFSESWSGGREENTPEDCRGTTVLHINEIIGCCSNALEFVAGVGEDMNDYVISQTVVGDLLVGDFDIKQFVYTSVCKKDVCAKSIDIEDISWVKRNAVKIFNDDGVENPF